MFNLVTILCLVGQTGLVRGTAVDSVSGIAISGANVVVVGSRSGVSTQDNGGFLLGPLRAGEYRLVASHIAFDAETVSVDVPENGVAVVSFLLVPKVIPIEGVRVQSRRDKGEEKMTVREISAERLERNAGGFVQDPVRSLSFLPGVGQSARGEWSGTYAVRGGETDESSVWFGNTELLWPYHLLGFSSVINPDIVGKVSFYPSVFPVRYGGSLSSIAVMDAKQLERGEGFWAYDPMNLKAAYVGNLGDIDFLASVRRTFYYVLFGPMGAGRANRPSYSDVNARVGLPLFGPHRLKVTVVNGSDHVLSDLRGVEEDISESGSSISADVESDLGRAKTDLQVYTSNHDFTMSPAVWWGTAVSRQSEYGVRFSIAAELSQEVEFGAGLEVGRAGFSGNLLAPAVLNRQDNTSALYASVGFRPVPQLGLDFGLRYEDVRWALDKVVQPRAVLSWYATDGLALKAGYRRHFQHSYSFLRNSCASFLFDQQYDDYRLFETGALAAKRADHYSVSAEMKPGPGTRVSLDGYVKEYSGLPTWKLDQQGLPYDVGNAGGGFARGVELTCEQQLAGGWTGWLTYALSWTKKQQGTDTVMYWDKYDRRNSLNAVVEKRWGDDWALTATFHLNTGAPYTPLLYTRSPNGTYGSDLNRGHSAWVIEGEKNSARVPVYHRLDLKLRRDLPKLPLHPYLYIEVINIYNQQNAYNLVQFEDRDGDIITGQSTGIPLTPLVGIGGRF